MLTAKRELSIQIFDTEWYVFLNELVVHAGSKKHEALNKTDQFIFSCSFSDIGRGPWYSG